MNKTELKELLLKVKALVFAEDKPAEQAEPQQLAAVEFKSKDGKSYKAAKLEAGEILEVADEAGAFAPAPAGQVEAEDGTVFVVDEAGKITEIKPAEAPKQEEPKPTEQFDASKLVSIESFNALQVKLNEATAAIQTLTTANAKSAEISASMFALVEALSNESEATPTSATKINTFKAAKTEKELAQAKLKEAFQATNAKK
jgi:hypothetical protein